MLTFVLIEKPVFPVFQFVLLNCAGVAVVVLASRASSIGAHSLSPPPPAPIETLVEMITF